MFNKKLQIFSPTKSIHQLRHIKSNKEIELMFEAGKITSEVKSDVESTGILKLIFVFSTIVLKCSNRTTMPTVIGENFSCSACGHPLQNLTNLLLDFPASEPLRRAIFGSTSIFGPDLGAWSDCWISVKLVSPRPHSSEGVGWYHHHHCCWERPND